MHTCMHAIMHACNHACMHTCIHTGIHGHRNRRYSTAAVPAATSLSLFMLLWFWVCGPKLSKAPLRRRRQILQSNPPNLAAARLAGSLKRSVSAWSLWQGPQACLLASRRSRRTSMASLSRRFTHGSSELLQKVEHRSLIIVLLNYTPKPSSNFFRF